MEDIIKAEIPINEDDIESFKELINDESKGFRWFCRTDADVGEKIYTLEITFIKGNEEIEG
jgi:hypothetical protein